MNSTPSLTDPPSTRARHACGLQQMKRVAVAKLRLVEILTLNGVRGANWNGVSRSADRFLQHRCGSFDHRARHGGMDFTILAYCASGVENTAPIMSPILVLARRFSAAARRAWRWRHFARAAEIENRITSTVPPLPSSAA